MVVAGIDIGPGDSVYGEKGEKSWEYPISRIVRALRPDCFFVWDMTWRDKTRPFEMYGKHVAKIERRGEHGWAFFQSSSQHYLSLKVLMDESRKAEHSWQPATINFHRERHKFRVVFPECALAERRGGPNGR